MHPATRDAIWAFEAVEKADLAKTRAETRLRGLLRRMPAEELGVYHQETEKIATAYDARQEKAMKQTVR